MRRRRLLLLLVVGGMEMVWLRQQAWLLLAVVVDLHATLPFIIITRCYGSRRG